jgi:hypothetical protein
MALVGMFANSLAVAPPRGRLAAPGDTPGYLQYPYRPSGLPAIPPDAATANEFTNMTTSRVSRLILLGRGGGV